MSLPSTRCGRYRIQSGHRAEFVNVQRLTHTDRLPQNFDATQHEERAATVRLLAVLHRDNRRLHHYAWPWADVPSGRFVNVAHFFEPF
jgi:hypothetical protein